jgi:predicted P-loop ATPase
MTDSNEPANGTPKGAAERMIADAAPCDTVSQATQFLELLGKAPAKTWFRTLKPIPGKGSLPNVGRKGADLHGFDPAALGANNRAMSAIYFITGDADEATGTNKEGKPSGAVDDKDVHTCRAVFVEWDDKPIEWQVQAWQELNLPEPTVMVSTGGKSIHCYWRLLEPMAPDPWRVLQARLIDYAGGDKNCKNPSRLMRLPGFCYVDKTTGKLTANFAELIHQSTGCYSAAEIEACLPALPPPAPAKAAKAAPSRQFEPRPEEELIEALKRVPVFAHGEGRREELLGLAFRLAAELGADRGLQLMQEHSPDVDDLADYFKAEPDHISAGSIWPFMREHYGIDISRKASTPTPTSAAKQDKPAPTAPATGNYSRPIRLETHQVMEWLPKRMGKLRLNVRSGAVIAEHDKGPITLSGNDIGRLYLQLSSQAEKWPKDTTADAVALLAGQSPFDPVADYLNSNTTEPLPMEQWQRLDQHLLDINDPIAAAFLPRYLISAVARVFQPGCYVRQTPVLIGKQERGKSELGRILFGAEHWVEGIGELGKDDLMKAQTAWGVELAELDGVTRKADKESLKAFLTEKTDTYRKPYDRAPEAHHRRFVFWGSSNGAPLRDTTGSTRFVCIPIPDRLLPLDWARQNRSAIWSRAVEQYRAGVDWIHTDEPMRAAIAERNSNFQEIDPWAGDIAIYLEQQQRIGQLPVKVTRVLDQMEVPKDRQNAATAKRVTAIAEQLGWVHGRRIIDKRKLTGLWPAAEDTGHPGHPLDTPMGVLANASDSNASNAAGHPGHPYSPTLSKVVRGQEPQQQPATAPATAAAPTPDTFGQIWVSGVSAPETDCAGVDLSNPDGCPEGCPEGCPVPDWHQKARLLHQADPGMEYLTLALKLQTDSGVNVTGRQVRNLLEQVKP